MTERDYILVSALQRLRAARDLVSDSRAHVILPQQEARWRRVLTEIRLMIEHLEIEVERARESDAAGEGGP